jgi:hypothetical protein
MVPVAHCWCATEQPAVVNATVVGLEVTSEHDSSMVGLPYWRGTPGRLSREPSAGYNVACVHLQTKCAARESGLYFETHGPERPGAMCVPNSALAAADSGVAAAVDSGAKQWEVGAARARSPPHRNRGQLSASCSSALVQHAAIPEVFV